jgi:predicted HTH domain antitoxin
MHTLTDQELRHAPQALLDVAQRHECTLVTTDGQPVLMAVPLANGIPLPAALVDLAAQLYDRELISLERAARIAGLSYSEMIDELGHRGIDTIRLTPGELERELASFGP